MPMAVKCNLFWHADGTCLVFQIKNVEDIASICDPHVNNKVSIKLGEDKTSPSISLLNVTSKKLQKLDIICNNIRIKQHCRVT